jgi:hypothetical protein
MNDRHLGPDVLRLAGLRQVQLHRPSQGLVSVRDDARDDRIVEPEDRAPRPTGKPLQVIDLTGKLFPWDGKRPVFLELATSPHLYFPCFSNAPKLRAAMARAKAPFVSIKHIDDGGPFLESLPRVINGRQVAVMLDPYWLPDGRVRWSEVKWN